MVMQILKNVEKEKEEPFLNEFGRWRVEDMQRYIAEKIIVQIKQTPELVGMLDTVVTDHFMGPIDLFTAKGEPLGRNNSLKQWKFWEDENIYNSFYGQGIDYFSDGNGFGWCSSAWDAMNEKQKEKLISLDQSYEGTMFEVNSVELAKQPKKISYISASTTEILYDEYGITGFKQIINNKSKIWSPEQIVHVKLMEMDGKARGHSGLRSLSREIALMYMIKENLIAKLQNGGSPDHIIYLKNANGISKARFQRLRLSLESFSHLRKSHGNMPIDADVGAIPLGSSIKDMEYRELAMFVVSEFCLAIGMPTSRVPFMMTGSGGVSNKGELSGNTEDAYQKKINNRRRQWEMAWNKKLRKKGFIFKFRKDNLQDNVRETQAAVQRSAFVEKTQDILGKRGKQLTEHALSQLLSGTKRNIDISDIEKCDEEFMMEQSSNGFNAHETQFDKADLKNRVTKDNSEAKKRTSNNNGVYV